MTYDFIKAVEAIERWFTPERVEPRKARLRAVWNLQRPDAIPYFLVGVPFEHRFGPQVGEIGCTPEETLEYLLEAILARAPVEDHYIPSLSPGLRQGLIPTAYGAQEVWQGDHYWVKPLVTSAEEFLSLPRPDFTRQGIAAQVLSNTRFFRQATAGRLPIQMPDMQGPLDLASNLLGTERLVEEMQDHPESLEAMLRQLTGDFITFMRLEYQAAQGCLVPIHCHPMVWIPPEHAMALSEDLLAVISPRLYARFGVPYNEAIADAFGKVIIHSCGSIEHNLAGLSQTRGLLGINFGVSETSIQPVAARFGSRVVILVHSTPVSCHGLPLLTDPYQFIDAVFPYLHAHDLRVIPMFAPAPGMSAKDCIELCAYARSKSTSSPNTI